MPREISAFNVIVHYCLIGLAGTSIVVLGSAYSKIGATREALERTRSLLVADQPAKAMGELEAIRRTSELYPRLRVEMECITIQCLARLGDFETAELMAEALQNRRVRGGGLPATLWEAIHSMPDPLVNAILARSVASELTTQSGYDALRRELERANGEQSVADIPATVPPATGMPVSALPSGRPHPNASAVPVLAGAKRPRWGVATAAKTRVYEPSGKFLRSIDAGTIFEIDSMKRSSVGEMALCTAMHPGTLGAPVLVRTSEMEICAGALSEVPQRERNLKAQRARLQAAILEAVKGPNPANPHTTRYTAIKAEHAAYWKKVKDLQTRRDNAHDADHVALADQLRKLKGEDIRLGQALEKAKLDYDAWEAAHPKGATETPEIRRIRDELARIDQQLRSL